MKLTKIEEAFAEQRHGLVMEYLKSKCLPEDEFYDIVIFSYLRAVQSYLANESLQKYSFKTIAFRAMDSALNNYIKSKQAKNHAAVVLSLDYPVNYTGTLTLQDVLEDTGCNVCEDVCGRLMLHDTLRDMNHLYRDMISLKISGYSNREIAKKYSVAVSDIDRCFYEMEDIISNIEMVA